MGACQFYEKTCAKSAKEAFTKLQEENQDMYGYDPYSGTIATCDGFRVMKSFSKYENSKERNFVVDKYIEEAYDSCMKRECRCIDLGPKYYERIIAKESPKKSDAVYRQKYVLEVRKNGSWCDEYISDTKKSLKEKACAYIANGDAVRITKKPVKVSGSDVVSEYTVKVEKFDKKPKKVAGTVSITEIHEYIFVGWAAE